MIRNSKSKDDCIGQTNGWACEHCVEKPISFPVMYRTLGENTGWFELTLAFVLIPFGFAMIAHILFII